MSQEKLFKFLVNDWIAEQKSLNNTEFKCVIKRETEKAYLIKIIKDNREIWLPKSQIVDYDELETVEFDFSDSLRLEKTRDAEYGTTKLSIKSDYNPDFIAIIKSLPWESSHRKWEGDRWTLDWSAVPQLVKLLKSDEQFAKTAQKISDFFYFFEKETSLFKTDHSQADESNENEIKIEINRTCVINYTTLYKINKNLKDEIHRNLSFKHPNERTVRRYSKKDLSNWDGRIKLYRFYKENNVIFLEFGTGLLNVFCNILKNNDIKYKIEDKRKILRLKNSISLSNLKLWKPQRDALDYILSQLRNFGSCIYQLPTGLGKTEVAISTIAQLRVKTIVLVNRKSLLYQWKNRISKRFNISIENIGQIGDGIYNMKEITVATYQSIHKYIKQKKITNGFEKTLEIFIKEGKIEDDFAPIPNDTLFTNFSLLIADEVHTSAARTYLNVLRQFTVKFAIGMSATTWRTDRMHPLLHYIFDQCGFSFGIRDAIDQGYLVDAEVKVITIKDNNKEYRKIDQTSRNNNTYQLHYKIMKAQYERNLEIAQLAIEAPKPSLIITSQLSHQANIYKFLKPMADQHNLSILVLSGRSSTQDREKGLQAMLDGNIDIALVNEIWNEGIDIPNLKSLFIVANGKSDVSLIQKVGRGLRVDRRPNSDKQNLIIYDFFDRDSKYFYGHFESRREVYEKFGFKIEYLEE